MADVKRSDKKGYTTSAGYMGYDPESSKYKLFSTEGEHDDFFDDLLKENVDDVYKIELGFISEENFDSFFDLNKDYRKSGEE